METKRTGRTLYDLLAEHKVITFIILFVLILVLVYLLINGYNIRYKNFEVYKKSITYDTSQANYNSKKLLPSTVNEVLPERSQNTNGLIFKESFNNNDWENRWYKNSDVNNFTIINDPYYGEILKITRSTPYSNSFLKRNFHTSLNGKKIQIIAILKYENIIVGQDPTYMKGCVCLKFTCENVDYYEAVQELEGTSEWKQHSAHVDGDTKLDHTQNGDYVIFVPKNAENVILYFGLQNCTGTIYFADIEVREIF